MNILALASDRAMEIGFAHRRGMPWGCGSRGRHLAIGQMPARISPQSREPMGVIGDSLRAVFIGFVAISMAVGSSK